MGKTVRGGEIMAFPRWEYVIIYNDGTQSKGTFGASSYAEAMSKALPADRGHPPRTAHGGVSDIYVSEI